ncbi:pectate lyase [Sporocytophaga myxococcoides]|uniref:Pectate lyase n=1 Tax=Sporocytophaga myxococcoides TaxID=153721 RepID=A0A098LK67_9BACT|nr:Ig-like domain-containing protein [Sporocytophaga myxococcoides]GAL87381.1 pectate lyase [Sporocytophaga myxococcoides]
MRRSIRLLLASIVLFTATIAHSQDQCKVVGWATQNGSVTGGGSATPKVVSTYADLKSALTTASVKVVHVQGTITFPTNGRITIQDQSGKTIIGLPNSKMVSVDMTASGSGIFYIKRCTNFIMRNLTFEGPGAYDTDGNDNLTLENCQNFWVDHCDFRDGMDGNFDIKTASDYISVTWCKFSYLKPPKAGGSGGSNDHRYTNLIGSSDGATGDDGKLRVTFQYCWWGQGCVERMPRVRFGKIHLVNNLFNSTVSNSCIRAGYKADLLIESNVFIGVNKPIDLYQNDFKAVTERNNIFTNTSGNTKGSGTSFTPPYSLTVSAASTVQSLVTNTSCGAGATLEGPTQCGCGTPPVNQPPTATLNSSASSVCAGTKITLTATANDSDGSISKVDFYNGLTLLGSDNSSPYTYEYTSGSTGMLSLKAVATDNSNAKGESSVITVTVSALPTATITSASSSFCEGESVVLTSSSGSSYTWKNGTTQVGTGSTYTAKTAGAYTVEVTNSNGCKATSAVKQIYVNALPTAIITAPASSFCEGASITLTASSGSSYRWLNGSTQVGTASTYTSNAAGAYTVEITDANGCKATSQVKQISINALPTAIITAPPSSFCEGASLILTASPGGASYQWYEGQSKKGVNPLYEAKSSGTYTVEITDANGCKATSVPVQIAEVPSAVWYQDTDNDGQGDAENTLSACSQPAGYVATAGDECPNDPNKFVPGNCGCNKSETECVTSTIGTINSGISVSPLPFDNFTSISLKNKGNIESVTIISASGAIAEKISGIHLNEIHIGETLAPGFYSVIVQTETEVISTKIIKK